jgi:hypothetical protein
VVELRKQLDAGGLDARPVTIAQHLALEDIRPPSTSTIRRILHNAGLVVANPKNSSADTPSTPPAPTGATQTENPADGHALNDDATHLSTMSRLITIVELRGLEPLTPCMPSGLTVCEPQTRIASSARSQPVHRVPVGLIKVLPRDLAEALDIRCHCDEQLTRLSVTRGDHAIRGHGGSYKVCIL